MSGHGTDLLPPELLARLARFRLANRHRVQGRFAGVHRSRRLGQSLDFADQREYVPGDDPRALDLNASRRLGRLLVRLYEAEDEASVRVVVDLSASMGFGDKLRIARQVAAAFAALAAGGQDRVRVLLAGAPGGVDGGPWFRGPSTLAAVTHRLLADAPPSGEDEPPGRADLVAAIRQAHGEGPAGPVVLVSDLLFPEWADVLQALAAGRGDAVVVQVLAREEVDPSLDGDLRLVDAETGEDAEVGVDDATLARYRRALDQWLDDVAATASSHGIGVARTVDDADVGDVLLTDLRALGVMA